MSVIATYPSRRRLPSAAPPGVGTVLGFLLQRYPQIPREVWVSRFARGLILDAEGPLPLDAPFRPGLEIKYFKEIPGPEPPVRTDVEIVYEDDELLIADKPHCLPVIPSGSYIHHCLINLLRDATGNEDLVPVHRIDRDTAGLVVCSKRPATRGLITGVLVPGRSHKEYRAICEVRGDVPAPHVQVSGHLALDQPFWKRRLVPGRDANSHTEVRRLHFARGLAYFRLVPHTGRTHQLRVHLASLGCPILNDRVYAEGLRPDHTQVGRPLQLLARRLTFRHPITGEETRVTSHRRLSGLALM